MRVRHVLAACLVLPVAISIADAADPGDVQSKDAAVRARAAGELGAARDKAAVAKLTPLLDDKVDYVVLAALIALGDVGDPAAAPAIEAKLGHGNFAIRAATLSQLGRIGGAASTLMKAYREAKAANPHEVELIKIIAVRSLSLCPDPAVVDSLVATEMDNPNTSDAVKEGLAAAAGATGEQKYALLLKRLLDEDPIRPMCGAAVGLAYLGDNSGVTKLIERLPTITDYNEARPIRCTLVRLTGENMWAAKQWASWWAKNQGTFRARRPEK